MNFYGRVKTLSRFEKKLIFLFLDACLVVVSFMAAIALSLNAGMSLEQLSVSVPVIAAVVFMSPLLNMALGLHRIKLNAYESRAIVRTGLLSLGIAITGLIANALNASVFRPEMFFILGMVFFIAAVLSRLALRNLVIEIYRRSGTRMRVIVYGAGQTGQQLAAALRTDNAVEMVAFVDDDPTLQSLIIAGLPVYAPAHLRELVAREKVDRIVLAMPSTSPLTQARISQRLKPLGIEVLSMPSFAALVSTGDLAIRHAPVPVADLLGRDNLDAELPNAVEAYAGQTILITGAGGSIGSELCRQLLKCAPRRLVLLDHSELALYNIDKELRGLPHTVDIVPLLGSVTDPVMVNSMMAQHKIGVVLHAAAYKHVPLVEANEISGLWNNVFGTKFLADAARAAGVPRFILISSDKAVRPTNVMGASKRLAELVVQDLATRSPGTKFAMVRFGNVLGSSGSVIPLFQEQIASGGPVTLTHGEVTRYFMTISEAARLVLIAGSYARGGDLFVLDMGAPIQIRTLARQMIEGAGLTVRDKNNPRGDIEILVTGLRPGEKLHEELLISSDMLTTPHPKILRAKEKYLSEIEVANALRDLREAVNTHDTVAARAIIARWVEKYDDAAPPALAEVN